MISTVARAFLPVPRCFGTVFDPSDKFTHLCGVGLSANCSNIFGFHAQGDLFPTVGVSIK